MRNTQLHLWDKFTPGSCFHEKCLAPGLLIDHGWGTWGGVTNSLSPQIFSACLGIQISKSSPTLTVSPSTPPFSSTFTFWSAWSEHYEGLPSPDVIQSKKSRNWFLIFVRCRISPHLWEHTASIISHLITLSKNGYRTAAVSASRGLTCTLKSNWRLYLYVFV